MGLRRIPWESFLLLGIFCIVCFKVHCESPELSVKFLQKPPQFSHLNSARFSFEALLLSTTQPCSGCGFNCKLDDNVSSDCGGRNVSYVGLQDGNHSVQVCANASQGVGCASYNWTIGGPSKRVLVTNSIHNLICFDVQYCEDNKGCKEVCRSSGAGRVSRCKDKAICCCSTR